jgi:hypothetical protein
MRFALAATLSSLYGIYSSYELCENTPVPGREEYLNSEKYEYKVWDWDRPGNIIPYITRVNAIRREHPALHLYDNLRFYRSDDEKTIVLEKAELVSGVLRSAHVRTHIDARDTMKPGAKYYEWERRGVPIRVEVGPKDVANQKLVVVMRTEVEGIQRKEIMDEAVALVTIPERLEQYQRALRTAAIARREANTHRGVTDYGTLKELVVPGTPMPMAKAVDAILQVIAGLDAAATIGILHRDIKPSNVFLASDGRVLVGDFGLSIATLARDEATLAVAGTIMGTPGFASPEQLRGEALDVRSDIYSVGATIYYLLTGKAPFDDPNIMTMITRVGS